MTITTDWRDILLDDRQRKETALAELYARDFGHGTTGHNALVLIARLAELLDAATGAKALPPPPEPADIRLTFGKWNGKTLGELAALDPGYLEWLGREARDGALRQAAGEVMRGFVAYDDDDDEDGDDPLL